MKCPECGADILDNHFTAGEITELLEIAKGRDSSLAVADLRDLLDSAMRSLTSREEKALRYRHGLWDGESQTLVSCGREFGVTRERFRQIANKAARKLAHVSRSRSLSLYLNKEALAKKET